MRRRFVPTQESRRMMRQILRDSKLCEVCSLPVDPMVRYQQIIGGEIIQGHPECVNGARPPLKWRIRRSVYWRRFVRWTVASPWPAFIAGGLTWMLIGRLIGAW